MGSLDSLHQPVLRVDVGVRVLLFVRWVADSKALPNRKVLGTVNAEAHLLIFRVRNGDVLYLVIIRKAGPIVEISRAGRIEPGAQDSIDRILIAHHVIAMYLIVLRLRAVKRCLCAAIAVVNDDPIALLGKLHAFPIGKFVKTPEGGSSAVRLTMIEAVGAALLLDVGVMQIGIPT